jgi:nitroimidazol reductase NimA-like FMN-containing flavoprotein (pyridoxamine 5'-phosphate oxidase superfamily)
VDATGWAADPGALNEFLAEPNLARVATIDDAGEPHVVPAWFWWDGESFWIGAQASDRKVANARRRGRAGIEVDADIRRRRGVYALGRARVFDGADGRREYIRITTEQVPRYQPGKPPIETARAYAQRGQPVVIQVTPDHLISWGR